MPITAFKKKLKSETKKEAPPKEKEPPRPKQYPTTVNPYQ